MTLTTVMIAIPLIIYCFTSSEGFLHGDYSSSKFAQGIPIQELGKNIFLTLGSFNFTGDYNQAHNQAGYPLLSLPVGILFMLGFIIELRHLLARKHSHWSTTHTFLFAWFSIMIIPGFFASPAPNALYIIGVIPVIMIFAARGFMWGITKIISNYRQTDPHFHINRMIYMREIQLVLFFVMGLFISSIGFLEYFRYFKAWAPIPATQHAFAQELVDISNYLNTDKEGGLSYYILVNKDSVLIDGLPKESQTIKFLTNTFTAKNSSIKKIKYLNDPSEIRNLPISSIIIPIEINEEFNSYLSRDPKLEKLKSFATFDIYRR